MSDSMNIMDPEALARALRPVGVMVQRHAEALKQAMTVIGKHMHGQLAPMSYGDDYRQHRRACRLCNPAGNPKPLTVNGAEYRRRTRARRRRNRR